MNKLFIIIIGSSLFVCFSFKKLSKKATHLYADYSHVNTTIHVHDTIRFGCFQIDDSLNIVSQNQFLIDSIRNFLAVKNNLIVELEVTLYKSDKNLSPLNSAVHLHEAIADSNYVLHERIRPKGKVSTNVVSNCETGEVQLIVKALIPFKYFENQEKLNKIDSLNKNNPENIKDFLLAADYYFLTGDYKRALYFYQISAALKPGDYYINNQIKIVSAKN